MSSYFYEKDSSHISYDLGSVRRGINHVPLVCQHHIIQCIMFSFGGGGGGGGGRNLEFFKLYFFNISLV